MKMYEMQANIRQVVISWLHLEKAIFKLMQNLT